MNGLEIRLSKEYNSIMAEAPEGLSVNLKNDNLRYWEALIFGPYDSPWENGIFKLDLQFPENYPLKPPTVQFITSVFHPNVYTSGKICLDILQSKWSPVQDIRSTLISIQSLLTLFQSYLDNVLNPFVLTS